MKLISSVSESQARAWNYGFAKNLLRIFRDLRDMVHKQLVYLQTADLANYEGNRKAMFYRNSQVYRARNDERSAPLKTANCPHFFDSQYMGAEFITELSENFHAENPFALHGLEETKPFLAQDRFSARFIPSEHIRVIKIHGSMHRFNIATGNGIASVLLSLSVGSRRFTILSLTSDPRG
jgi:hypothetical protein